MLSRPKNLRFFIWIFLVTTIACGRMMGTGGGGPAGSPGALPLGAAGSPPEGELEDLSSLGSNPSGDIFGGDLGGGPVFQSPLAGGEGEGGGLFSPAPDSIFGGSPSPGPEGGINLLGPIFGNVAPGPTDIVGAGVGLGNNGNTREAMGGSETPSADQTSDTPQTPDAGGGPVASALPSLPPCAGTLQFGGLEAFLTGVESEGGTREVFLSGSLTTHVALDAFDYVADLPVYKGEVAFSSVRPSRTIKMTSLPSVETDGRGFFCKYVIINPERDRIFLSARRLVLPRNADYGFCDEKPLAGEVAIVAMTEGQSLPPCFLRIDPDSFRPVPLELHPIETDGTDSDQESGEKSFQKDTNVKIIR